MVTNSLVENNVPRAKILESNYGWSPTRQSSLAVCPDENLPINFIFVGSGIMRKGIFILAEIWNEAKINGKLYLAGNFSNSVLRQLECFFSREDVIRIGFVDDVDKIFSDAHIFILPTLEEGDPLVTYEAMAAGLPVLVSQMGAGSIAVDGKHGFVIDPYDIQEWVSCMQFFDKNRDRWREFSSNARRRALEFTWEHVGRKRYSLLKKTL